MIHLALWIASTLFVIWFFAVCGVLVLGFVVAFWRWIVGAIAVTALLIFVNTYEGKKAQPEPVAQGVSAWDAEPSPSAPVPPRGPTASELTDATRTAMVGAAPPVPQFTDVEARLAYLSWLGSLSSRLQTRIPDWAAKERVSSDGLVREPARRLGDSRSARGHRGNLKFSAVPRCGERRSGLHGCSAIMEREDW